jgi:bifunctional UDP-N-acetylglucosamine pyrophosphorylase/glucosamine-1-phosphate N-acetyltransferase
MKSEKLKVMHQVAGKPIVNYVVETVQKLGVDEVLMVVGHQAELVRQSLSQPNISFVLQKEQLGTGHAVMQVIPALKGKKDHTLLVLAGDCPLIELETLENLLATHRESNAAATILTAKLDEPDGYGRIIRGKMGTVIAIRESKDCTASERKIREINTGTYVFQMKPLFESLGQLNTDNKQQEYYLTDVVDILKKEGKSVAAYRTENADQVLGINTRLDLSKINQILYQRNNEMFMHEGVTIIDPNTTFIDSTVHIGRDTIIYPFCNILAHTVIGNNCQVGPNCFIRNGKIAAGSVVTPFTKIDLDDES